MGWVKMLDTQPLKYSTQGVGPSRGGGTRKNEKTPKPAETPPPSTDTLTLSSRMGTIEDIKNPKIRKAASLILAYGGDLPRFLKVVKEADEMVRRVKEETKELLQEAYLRGGDLEAAVQLVEESRREAKEEAERRISDAFARSMSRGTELFGKPTRPKRPWPFDPFPPRHPWFRPHFHEQWANFWYKLKQIEEEKKLLPPPVKAAVETVNAKVVSAIGAASGIVERVGGKRFE